MPHTSIVNTPQTYQDPNLQLVTSSGDKPGEGASGMARGYCRRSKRRRLAERKAGAPPGSFAMRALTGSVLTDLLPA
jgi:hypothetical protein